MTVKYQKRHGMNAIPGTTLRWNDLKEKTLTTVFTTVPQQESEPETESGPVFVPVIRHLQKTNNLMRRTKSQNHSI
jgi:hypothetical protein